MTMLASPWMITVRNHIRHIGIVRAIYRLWMSNKGYEDNFGSEFIESVTPDSVVWDVGANLGLYSRRALEKNARHVVCIEPAPDAIDALRRELSAGNSKSSRVTIVPAALSDVNGTATFAADGSSPTNRLEPAGSTAGSALQVRVTRAEDLVASDTVPEPTVVKIDVEGYELEVLRGFGSLLRSQSLRAIFVEVHFSLLHQRGLDAAPKEIERMLGDAGFAVRWLDLSHVCGQRLN